MTDLAFDRLAFDRASVRSYDADGRLHVVASNLSKANVCPYYGREIPGADTLGLDPDRTYRMLRDPAELARATASFDGLPLLSRHTPVTAADPRPELVVGATGTVAAFMAPYLVNALVIWDAAAIADIEAGRARELSCGYRYRPDMTPGTLDGEPYDGVMRDIVGNHVALVPAGRAGPDVVVGDAQLEGAKTPMADRTLSRTAALVKGALTGARLKLATDAKPDLGRLVAGITNANWRDRKPQLVAALKPSLAQDANLDDLTNLLDSLDGDDLPDDDVARDAEGLNEEEEKQFQALLGRRKPAAPAQDESDDDDDKPPPRAPDADDKPALDAAIRIAETRAIERINAIRAAERAVRPHIGDLALTMDSAEAVYKLALDAAKVDLNGVPPAAYAAMVRMLPVPGAAAKAAPAFDHAAAASLAARFPHATRLKRV